MIDHDRLFKELLMAHICEFIELLMPEVAAYLDKDSLQLADKELFVDNMLRLWQGCITLSSYAKTLQPCLLASNRSSVEMDSGLGLDFLSCGLGG